MTRSSCDDKHAASRLSFAVMLKFFEIEGRFPRRAGEVLPAAVDYVARRLGLPSGTVPPLTASGHSVQRFRGQIRDPPQPHHP